MLETLLRESRLGENTATWLHEFLNFLSKDLMDAYIQLISETLGPFSSSFATCFIKSPGILLNFSSNLLVG